MTKIYFTDIWHFSWTGEAICSVYIQPEGFGPPPQQQIGGYRKEYAQTFQSTEQKSQTGSQSFQQRSYQQTIDKRSYVNGTSTSIEDFKVQTFPIIKYLIWDRILSQEAWINKWIERFIGGHVRIQTPAWNRISRIDYSPFRGRIGRTDFDGRRPKPGTGCTSANLPKAEKFEAHRRIRRCFHCEDNWKSETKSNYDSSFSMNFFV